MIAQIFSHKYISTGRNRKILRNLIPNNIVICPLIETT